MIKKISVDQLKPGMYVEEFDCGWMRHPFLTNSIKIKNEKTILKIVDYGIRHVYIDSEKGTDVHDAPTREEIIRKVNDEMYRAIGKTTTYRDTVPVHVEIVKAKSIKNEAKKAVRTLMEDVRVGRQVKIEKVEPLAEKLVQSILRNKTALTSLGRIKKVDEYTFEHSVSVGALIIAFARQLGFDYDLIKTLGIGGLLHDVGKIKVSPGILTKKGSLTDAELSAVKKHVENSRTILEEADGIDSISFEAVVHHHERIDGTGYPGSLTGKNISVYGQMSAIVDVYDAITSNRCYQTKMLPTEALRKLYEWSEFHYNRELVQHFIRCVGIYPVGTLVQLRNGMLGVVISHNPDSLLRPVVRIIYDTSKERFLRISHDIDLSQSGDEEQILSYESPEKYQINPESFI